MCRRARICIFIFLSARLQHIKLQYSHIGTQTHTLGPRRSGGAEQRAPVISFWCCTRHMLIEEKNTPPPRAESWIIIFALCSFMHIAHLSLFFPLRRVRVCILNSLVYTCFTYCKEPFVSEWVSERASEGEDADPILQSARPQVYFILLLSLCNITSTGLLAPVIH